MACVKLRLQINPMTEILDLQSQEVHLFAAELFVQGLCSICKHSDIHDTSHPAECREPGTGESDVSFSVA